MSLEYFLGNLGLGDQSSEQAKRLRDIILTNKPEPEIISDLKKFVLSQNGLHPDAASIINRAIMTHYGAEYLGLGKDDFLLKSILYRQFIERFPDEFSFKFHYADCCLMTDKSANEIFPILKEGMLQDEKNINYPSAELFDLIHSSEFSFEFDVLLLEKYYQPCKKEEFDEWITEFKERYKSKEQQDHLENLTWKGDVRPCQ